MTYLSTCYVVVQNSWIKVAKTIILLAQQNWSAHSPPSGGYSSRCFSLMVVLNSLLLLSIGCWSFSVRLKNLILINTRCASNTYKKRLISTFNTIKEYFPFVTVTPAIKTTNYYLHPWFQFFILTFIICLLISKYPLQLKLHPRLSNSNVHGNKIIALPKCFKFNISQELIPVHYQSSILHAFNILYTGGSPAIQYNPRISNKLRVLRFSRPPYYNALTVITKRDNCTINQSDQMFPYPPKYFLKISTICNGLQSRPILYTPDTYSYKLICWNTASKTSIPYAYIQNICLLLTKTSVFQKTSGSRPSKLAAPLPSREFDIDKASILYTLYTQYYFLSTQTSTTSTTYIRIYFYYYNLIT